MAKSKKKAGPTPVEFVGAQMANLLYAIEHDAKVPVEYRDKAHALRERWDSLNTFRLNNPITAALLEAALFPESYIPDPFRESVGKS
jgi:hypothetical protein